MSGMTREAERDVAALEQSIGHVFADKSLLAQALTHASAATPRSGSYERLEFLGDRVLGLGVAHMLMGAYGAESEGPLSHRLAALVRKETCAEVAREWGVGAFIRMGEGEALSGGRDKTAILGDVCEAIIGAVFLDAGADVAEAVVRRAFESRMVTPTRRLRDPKTVLQEWAQGRKLPAPTYRLARRSGPDHAPRFEIRAEIEGFEEASGEGPSKRAAEQAAAQSFLQREGIETENAEPS